MITAKSSHHTLLTMVAAVVASLMLALSAAKAERFPAEAPTIVLVHGAFMDAGSWEKLRRELATLGYRTTAVSVPGRPAAAESDAVASLAAYRDAVLKALDRETRPVLLVGHSFGGMTISAVAEAAPEKVAALVYLAAYLPTDGQSLQTLAGSDRDSRTGAAFVVDTVRGVASIEAAMRGALFCNDCDAATAADAAAMMVEEPLGPLAESVRLSEGHGRTRRFYIRTAQDLVVSTALQDRMIAASPVEATLNLDTGHSPMLSQPGPLAALLASIVDELVVPTGGQR